MTNQTPSMPGSSPPVITPVAPQNNPQFNRAQPGNAPSNAPVVSPVVAPIAPPGAHPQAPVAKTNEATKLPTGDTSGEMEQAGGGRKSAEPVVPARADLHGAGTKPVIAAAPVEPKKDSNERSDAERTAAANSTNSGSKQQSC